MALGDGDGGGAGVHAELGVDVDEVRFGGEDVATEPHQVATRFKGTFRQQLVDLAREAGIRDAEPLGKQLSVIYNGAILESAIFNDSEPIETARQLALELFDTQTSQS